MFFFGQTFPAKRQIQVFYSELLGQEHGLDRPSNVLMRIVGSTHKGRTKPWFFPSELTIAPAKPRNVESSG